MSKHPSEILMWLSAGVFKKYKIGAKKHGGSLQRKRVVEHIGEEIIDLAIYYETLARQISVIGQLAEIGLISPDEHGKRYFKAIVNLVKHGNITGWKEVELEETDNELSVETINRKQIAEEMIECLKTLTE